MYLKRLCDKSDPQNPRVNGVRILSLGASTEQHFSPELVADAIQQGWMAASAGMLTINAVGRTVEYTIRRGPGYYCCHCGERLPGTPGAADPVARTIGTIGNDRPCILRQKTRPTSLCSR